MSCKIKIVFLTLVLISISAAVNAQFSKGNVLLGGTINFFTQVQPEGGSNNKLNENTFGIAPTVGFFLNDRFAMGAMVVYSTHTRESGVSPNNSIETSNNIGAGIFGRRYFTISDQFFFTLQGNLSFSRNNHNFESTGSNLYHDESYSISAEISPFLVFMPSPHWGFEGGIGSLTYTHLQGLSDDNSSNSFQLYAGNIYFGIAYYFRKTTE